MFPKRHIVHQKSSARVTQQGATELEDYDIQKNGDLRWRQDKGQNKLVLRLKQVPEGTIRSMRILKGKQGAQVAGTQLAVY